MPITYSTELRLGPPLDKPRSLGEIENDIVSIEQERAQLRATRDQANARLAESWEERKALAHELNAAVKAFRQRLRAGA